MKIYDFVVRNAKGVEVPMTEFSGKVLLIVNTATGCGFTPQYEGLQNLYDKYKDKGVEILDFPLFVFLKKQKGGFMGNDIKWNFTKFLVSRDGTVVERFAPVTKPEKIESNILKLL
jgi:glutathione peroxidase